MAATAQEPRVSALYIYPIKSCKGIALQSAVLTKQGLYYDRQWMVIKAATGRFVTQRETAKMALVGVSLPAEALAGDWGKLPVGAAMEVTAPGMPPLLVPLSGDAPLQTRQATVWEWTGTTADAGDDAAEWFSQFLGQPVRLVRYLGSPEASEQVPNTVRRADETFALNYEVRFTDGFPMLLATEAALADLNSKIQGPPLLMNRFRANIIVGGTQPWAEDTWRGVKVLPSGADAAAAPLELTAVKPCSRCKVTTIDQATAEAGDEPLDTLGTIRSGKVLGWNSIQKSWTHAVFFGWNCVSRSTGRISVGDAVAVSQPHDIAVNGLTPAA